MIQFVILIVTTVICNASSKGVVHSLHFNISIKRLIRSAGAGQSSAPLGISLQGTPDVWILKQKKAPETSCTTDFGCKVAISFIEPTARYWYILRLLLQNGVHQISDIKDVYFTITIYIAVVAR